MIRNSEQFEVLLRAKEDISTGWLVLTVYHMSVSICTTGSFPQLIGACAQHLCPRRPIRAVQVRHREIRSVWFGHNMTQGAPAPSR